VICKYGVAEPGKATVTLERDAMTLVVKGVPALICTNCWEEYVDEAAATALLAVADAAAQAGVQVDVREYVAA
jgi:YgiT-type zinc finger domain-containing protein